MSQIIVFPRGQLTEIDRARMEEVGIVAVEADNPEAVVTTVPGVPLASSDDLVLAALHAVVRSQREETAMLFAKELHRRIVAQEQQPTSHGAGVSDA